MRSQYVIYKSESGEVIVTTPVYVCTDMGNHPATLRRINALCDHIKRKAPEGSALLSFIQTGSTEAAEACAMELEAHVIPRSPAGIRGGLLWLRDCLKEGPACFITDNTEPEEKPED